VSAGDAFLLLEAVGAHEGDVLPRRAAVGIFIRDGATVPRRAGADGSRGSAVLSPSPARCGCRLAVLRGVSVRLGPDASSEFSDREDAGEDSAVCLAPCAAVAGRVMCFQPRSPRLDVGTDAKAGRVFCAGWSGPAVGDLLGEAGGK